MSRNSGVFVFLPFADVVPAGPVRSQSLELGGDLLLLAGGRHDAPPDPTRIVHEAWLRDQEESAAGGAMAG